MHRIVTAALAAFVLLGGASAWADNCSDLRNRIARLDDKSSALPGYLDLRAVLGSIYYRTCQQAPVRDGESWYDIDGGKLGAATGGRPSNAAYTATDEVAKACANSGNPSMCAMIRGSVAMCADPPEGEAKRACVIAGGYPAELWEESNAPPLPAIAITLGGRRYQVPGECADRLANLGDGPPGEHRVLRNSLRRTLYVDGLKADCPADFVDGLASRLGSAPDALAEALPRLAQLVAGGFGVPGAGAAAPARTAWADPGFQEMCRQARANNDTCRKRQAQMGPVGAERLVRGSGQTAAFADCAALYGSVARMCTMTEARATQPPPPPLPVVARPAPAPTRPENAGGHSAPPPRPAPAPQMSAQCEKLVSTYVAAAQANDGPRALAGYNALKGAGGCGVLDKVDRAPPPAATTGGDSRFISRGERPNIAGTIGACDRSTDGCAQAMRQLEQAASPAAQAAMIMNAVQVGLELGAAMASGLAATAPQGGGGSGTNYNSIGNRPAARTYGQGAPQQPHQVPQQQPVPCGTGPVCTAR